MMESKSKSKSKSNSKSNSNVTMQKHKGNPKIKQLWKEMENEIIQNVQKSYQEKKNNECYLLVVGDKHAGKTTFIRQFIGKTSKQINLSQRHSTISASASTSTSTSTSTSARPTIGLEYYYGRRPKPGTSFHLDSIKETIHIWELGGGFCNHEFMSIPLMDKPIQKCSIAILVDLSKPQKVLPSLTILLEKIQLSISNVFKDEWNPNEINAQNLTEQ